MSDHIIRAITADGSVKAVAITGRDLVERARTIHTLLPVATAALGRTLLAASMMGDMLKEDNGALTLQIKGGGPLGTILEEVLSDFQLEVLETHPVEYRCSCSRERVSRALISMGREELSSLIAEQGQADLSCQFCDKVYHFSKEELEGLLSSM